MPETAFIYGRRPVQEALRHASKRVIEVVLAEHGGRGGLEDLAAAARQAGVRLRLAAEDELERLAPDAVHQGAFAYVRPREPVSLDELAAAGKNGRGLIVALDHVTDPHNFGAVLRAVECAGADGVLVSKSGSSPVTPVVRKSSAGASELVPLCIAANLVQALEKLKSAGFWIVGTALDERSVPLYQAEIPTPAVIVIGSEGKGIRRLTAEKCDVLLQIPLAGMIQSLNVSQAAAVVLFEAARRRSPAAD